VTVDALAVGDLTVPFGELAGLVGVSLTVARGERLAVLGPSGAGKTTLLRAVAGLVPVARGRVVVDGRDVTTLAPERRDAVYLHQTPVLFPHLSVAENVAFPLRVRGQRGAAAESRVRDALAAVHVGELADRSPSSLSGGQRHRVALARAMAARPAVLLLDEPLAALDPALRDDVRGAIRAAQAAGGTDAPGLVIVTHDLDDAALLGHRVAVLLDGRLAQVTAPRELFTRPATLGVARFLAIFQEVHGVLRDDGAVTCALGVVPVADPPTTHGPVTVAFRADAVRLCDAAGGSRRARVVDVRHRANGAGIVVRVTDGGTELEAAARPGDARWNVGDEVGVTLDPSGALVFPA
jgi:ABC-type Fe3+/spermidine/putrescine transport system ATPase subunit